MKCMLKAKTADKESVLGSTYFSCEQKVKNGNTYLWYELAKYAREDKADIEKKLGVQVEFLKGWENDGFVNL